MQRRLAGSSDLEAARRLVVGGRAGLFFHLIEHGIFFQFFDVMRDVGFFLVDDLLLDRARRTVIGGNGGGRLSHGGSSSECFGLRLRLTDSADHFFHDIIMPDHRLAGEGRSQIHTILQSVLALPLLVNGFIAMLVTMLFVQRLGETGRKQRLIVWKAHGNTGCPLRSGSRFLGRVGSAGLAGPAAILRNRLARQDDRLISRRRSVVVNPSGTRAGRSRAGRVAIGGVGATRALAAVRAGRTIRTVVAFRTVRAFFFEATSATTAAAAEASAVARLVVTGLAVARVALAWLCVAVAGFGPGRGSDALLFFERFRFDHVGSVLGRGQGRNFRALWLRP